MGFSVRGCIDYRPVFSETWEDLASPMSSGVGFFFSFKQSREGILLNDLSAVVVVLSTLLNMSPS